MENHNGIRGQIQERWRIFEIAISFREALLWEQSEEMEEESYPSSLVYDLHAAKGNDQPDFQFVFALSPSCLFKALIDKHKDED